MATALPTTLYAYTPTTAGVDTPNWDSTAAGVLADASSATFGYVATNTDGLYTHGWTIKDSTGANAIPADFSTMASVLLQLWYKWDTSPTGATVWQDPAATGTMALSAIITDSSGTTVYANSDGSVNRNYKEIVALVGDGVTTETASSSVALTLTSAGSAAGKTAWESALVHIRIGRDKIKGGSTNQQQVTRAQITGSYNASAGTIAKQAMMNYRRHRM